MNIEVKLGGETRTLRTTMGFYRHVKAITKEDPLDWTQALSGDIDSIYDTLRVFILAGLRCYWDSIKQPHVDEKEILTWLDDMTQREAGALIADMVKIMNEQEPTNGVNGSGKSKALAKNG